MSPAALAYSWQDITTDRTETAAGVDHLRAEFNANAWSGRVEGGYRFVTPWWGGIGLVPYGAAQFTTFDLPAYAEQVISGASTFALSYAAKSVTETRTELGMRSDKSFVLPDGVFTLRGRLAWTQDFNPDRALTTASAEMKWMNGWSAAAIFEDKLSHVARSYAGKGVVRYAW